MSALVIIVVKGKFAELKWLSGESLEARIALEGEMDFGPGKFINLTYKGTTRSFTVCSRCPRLVPVLVPVEGWTRSKRIEEDRNGEWA